MHETLRRKGSTRGGVRPRARAGTIDADEASEALVEEEDVEDLPLEINDDRKIKRKGELLDWLDVGKYRDIVYEDSFIEPEPADWFTEDEIDALEESGPKHIDDLRIRSIPKRQEEWLKNMSDKLKNELDIKLKLWFIHKYNTQELLDDVNKGEKDHEIMQERIEFLNKLHAISSAGRHGAWEKHLYDRDVPMSVLGTNSEDQNTPDWHKMEEVAPSDVIRRIRKRQWISDTFDESKGKIDVQVWFDTSDPGLGQIRPWNPLREWGLLGKDLYSGYDVRVIVKEEGATKARFCDLTYFERNSATPTGVDVGLNQVMQEIEKCFVIRIPTEEKDKQEKQVENKEHEEGMEEKEKEGEKEEQEEG